MLGLLIRINLKTKHFSSGWLPLLPGAGPELGILTVLSSGSLPLLPGAGPELGMLTVSIGI